MFNPNYDPAKRQSVTCEKCGNEIPLQRPDEWEWSLFTVHCDFDGEYVLSSKFKIEQGRKCPRCKQHKLMVSERQADTAQQRELIKARGSELWQFIGEGEVRKVD